MTESLGLGLLIALTAIMPVLAETCSDRKEVCYAYCDKSSPNVPKCREVCGSILNTCMATGCWESRITAKRCGFAKQ